ncbi:MAG TPA: response regulator transcription factor [Chitinophagaceae bacterium]|nr:response regulator transcription factor [Chitinophagaceae bacterium]
MSKTKILYVEDETAMARIVSDALQSRGYEVALETQGETALARFKQVLPHVCVLDVMLPGKDGFAIADEIRMLNIQVPIIFLTAKVAVSDVLAGFKRGGNDYIRKPFSIEELIVRIENVLKEKPAVSQPEEEEVTLGKYTFQKVRQVLTFGEEQRKLSYRESELLKLLYENRNSIVARRDILNLLWGSDSFFNSRTLDVYITKLRNYFKADPSIEIITIKGIGYRFVSS